MNKKIESCTEDLWSTKNSAGQICSANHLLI